MNNENTKTTGDCEQVQPMVAQNIPSNPLDGDIFQTQRNLQQLKNLAEFRDAARPLMQYMRKNHHPGIAAIVDQKGVRLIEDIQSVQF